MTSNHATFHAYSLYSLFPFAADDSEGSAFGDFQDFRSGDFFQEILYTFCLLFGQQKASCKSSKNINGRDDHHYLQTQWIRCSEPCVQRHGTKARCRSCWTSMVSNCHIQPRPISHSSQIDYTVCKSILQTLLHMTGGRYGKIGVISCDFTLSGRL